MGKVFSNTNTKKDILGISMEKYASNSDVCIAVAFFTDDRFIKKLVDKGSRVKLIVRLGFPTSPSSLERVLKFRNVSVRFFTSRSFHSKLYIYGDDIAFVGSSNLTDAGLFSNRELNLSIDSEDSNFGVLKEIFFEYWDEAEVLTDEKLKKYKFIIGNLEKEHEEIERKVSREIGDIAPPNDIRIHKKKRDSAKEYEEFLLRRYQVFLGKFKELQEIYESMGKRQVTKSALPISIEIHRFLNWVRKNKAYSDLYVNAPERKGEELIEFVKDNIKEFMEEDLTNHFNNVIEEYEFINNNFSSVQKIRNLNDKELLETIKVVSAFYEHIRHSTEMSLQYEFLQQNGIEKIKDTIAYLLFGDENYIKRITNCIFNPEFKLSHFGQSCIQELFGWVNKESIPICNERAYKSMRWLGFGKF
ncbi:phospholipase D-like domain-containing protein [Bacillus proteolyticus]|uniref:phospholipase D-like domain-containing protein n=1 Tax=Bacillus proteolyticus TaxID=2026192 RepID=UPI0030F48C7B